MNVMPVYKVVVRRNENELVLAWAYGRAQVQYVPNKWAEPPDWLQSQGYGLFAFGDFYDALHFCADQYDEVWEAEGENPRLPDVPFLLLQDLAKGEITTVKGYNFPPGTIMCDRIRLIRWVYPEPKDVPNE